MNIGEMQRLLSQKAEGTPDHKFDDLFSLVCRKDWLRLASDYVAQNIGNKTAGCDGIDMGEFEEDLEGNLGRLRSAIQSETFVACPVRRVYIPKPNGKVRPLGIPTIRDRVVQEAVRMVLEPNGTALRNLISHNLLPHGSVRFPALVLGGFATLPSPPSFRA
jgi:RNA-directed DNA polymerase